MPVDSKHPEYQKRESAWAMIRDVVAGEDAVRANVQRYLPPPPGMKDKSTKLQTVTEDDQVIAQVLRNRMNFRANRYEFYSSFAELPEYLFEIVDGLMGLIHEREATYELPEDMEYLVERATPSGKTLQKLWEFVTRETLTVGRIELLGEVVGGDGNDKDDVLLCPYVAESLINWQREAARSARVTLVVLKECSYEPRDDDKYEYDKVERIVELELIELDADAPTLRVRAHKKNADGKMEVVKDDDTDAEGWVVPQRIGKKIGEIPITVINATDTGLALGPIPIQALARCEISMFRKTADYNRALYMKGEPQPWITGVQEHEAPERIGGDTVWTFASKDAKCGYLDIEGEGIPYMLTAIENKEKRFAQLLGKLLFDDGGGTRSGEAVRREQAPKKATVRSVIIDAAAGMEQALRMIGRMMGKSEDEVKKITFKPWMDFAEPLADPDKANKWMAFKMQGGPISYRKLFDWLKKGGMVDGEYEDMLAEMAAEGPPIRLGDPGAYESPEGGDPAQQQAAVPVPAAAPAPAK